MFEVQLGRRAASIEPFGQEPATQLVLAMVPREPPTKAMAEVVPKLVMLAQLVRELDS